MKERGREGERERLLTRRSRKGSIWSRGAARIRIRRWWRPAPPWSSTTELRRTTGGTRGGGARGWRQLSGGASGPSRRRPAREGRWWWWTGQGSSSPASGSRSPEAFSGLLTSSFFLFVSVNAEKTGVLKSPKVWSECGRAMPIWMTRSHDLWGPLYPRDRTVLI